ncbi:MAG: hypothetical protein J2P25_01210 [Nocardiopsaceae bacterium]|nr:hypothetical protein [Nocardiopsaceae bacterium]
MHSNNPLDRDEARRKAEQMPPAERAARRQLIGIGIRKAGRSGKSVFRLVMYAPFFALFGFLGGYLIVTQIGNVLTGPGAAAIVVGLIFWFPAGLFGWQMWRQVRNLRGEWRRQDPEQYWDY